MEKTNRSIVKSPPDALQQGVRRDKIGIKFSTHKDANLVHKYKLRSSLQRLGRIRRIVYIRSIKMLANLSRLSAFIIFLHCVV